MMRSYVNNNKHYIYIYIYTLLVKIIGSVQFFIESFF